jgi:hypothetical protein
VATTSTDQRLNPYQPPQSAVGEIDLSAPTQVSFQLNRRLRRHAEAQYLLHWRPKLMLFSSLAMILVSCIAILVSFISIPESFPAVFLAALLISAAIYLALVHHAKRQVRRRQYDHGLTTGEMISLESDSARTTLLAGGQRYVWPNDQLSVYATPRGLLICPEPFLYLFIPKKSSFQLESYKQFAKLITSRAPPR